MTRLFFFLFMEALIATTHLVTLFPYVRRERGGGRESGRLEVDAYLSSEFCLSFSLLDREKEREGRVNGRESKLKES